MVNVGESCGFEQLLSAFQFLGQFSQQFQCRLFLKAHATLFMPDWREVHTSFEVSDADMGAFLICMQEQ